MLNLVLSNDYKNLILTTLRMIIENKRILYRRKRCVLFVATVCVIQIILSHLIASLKLKKKCRNVRCRSYNLRIVVYYNHAYFTTSHSNYLQIQEVTVFNESKKSQEKKIKDYRKNEYHEGAVKQSPQWNGRKTYDHLPMRKTNCQQLNKIMLN